MNTIQRIAKNTGVLAIMNIATMILGLIFTASFARYFGDAAFGKYSFALAFTSLFAILLDLGFNELAIREISRDKKIAGKYIGNIMIIKILLTIFFIFIISIIINILQYPSDTKTIVYILGSYTILISFGQLFRAVFHGFEKMEYNSLLTIIEKIIIVSIGLILIFLQYELFQVVSVYLVGGIFDFIFGMLFTIKRFTKPKFEIDIAFWKSTIISAIPFSLTFIFVNIYNKIDTVMLSIMINDAVVGWYNAAYRLVINLNVLPSVLILALYPVLSRFHTYSSKKSLKLTYEKALRLLFLIGFPIGVGTTLIADKIILLIFGDQFFSSIIALKILIWMFVINCCAWLMAIVLHAINKQNIVAFSMGLCAIFNIVSNYFIIPKLSYIGACITTIATYLLALIILFYFISKYLDTTPFLKIIIKPVLAGLAMGIIVYHIMYLNPLFIISIACMIYFAILLIFGEISKEDLILVKKIFGRN